MTCGCIKRFAFKNPIRYKCSVCEEKHEWQMISREDKVLIKTYLVMSKKAESDIKYLPKTLKTLQVLIGKDLADIFPPNS